MGSIELNCQNRKTKHQNFGKISNTSNKNILRLADPHLDSFNFFLENGLDLAVKNIPPLEFALLNGDKVTFLVQSLEVGKPQVHHSQSIANINLLPRECIESGISYKAALTGTLLWMVGQRCEAALEFPLGDIPIMVKSKRCHLYGMTPKELVSNGELVNETGGYFIINGVCRVLRLLIANRRNYPLAILRNAWKARDINFSEKGILMRCVSEDETSSVNILHYLATGGAKLEVQVGREIFLIPLMLALKVLMNYSDRLLYNNLIRGRQKDNFYSEKVKMMLRELQAKKLYNQTMCKEYIGRTFRSKFPSLAIWIPDDEVCDYLFNNFVLIHLEKNKQKFATLCIMARKLFAFVAGECATESLDVVSMQEAHLGGHTYLQLIKEKLVDALNYAKISVNLKNKEDPETFSLTEAIIRKGLVRATSLGDAVQTFLATGTLPGKIRCGLMQTNGLSVIMERLNRMRDMSHLRAIHRGSFFLDMKTIGPRRLTGEAWGFICPVHTPDGAPCGLLNHLAYHCIIPRDNCETSVLAKSLSDLGMTPVEDEPLRPYDECLEVMLDGCLVGYITKIKAKKFTSNLRAYKVFKKIYPYTEIVLIEERKHKAQYPGLFIITTSSRMMRPVINMKLKKEEYIGTFEQLYMNVAVSLEDFEEGVHTHMDIEKTSILSNIGRLVPFSDCNPNPRNMYQCQMGKQTMGTPVHNWRSQTNGKIYRLQYPQIPLVRNKHYDDIEMEEFCMGFNAVLAIVSYTGYDMEDAMVINKCSMERGLAHGQVYKSEFIDLGKDKNARNRKGEFKHHFKRDPSNTGLENFLDSNGLPYPGTRLSSGDPYYCVYDVDQDKYSLIKYKGEDCCVDKYTIINSQNFKEDILQKVNITIRIRRDPIIGDKFASRSGQKGIMSRLYPMEDLPFSERGITPDIIFNPHGIPSRMTAGTLIELVAGKSAAEFGKAFDSTPFSFNDENPAFDYFGQILEKAGFNYYGEDVLYSGTDGRMMEVEIFEGVLYYQRLRHMTADKWQVRSTGPMDNITRQPIKGRKRGGAIRFGEMERDCLISHGAAFTLKDRLLDCSDKSEEWVCKTCGSVLAPTIKLCNQKHYSREPVCSVCGPEHEVRLLSMPYAFKFLVAELSSVGIKTVLGLKTAEEITREGLPGVIETVKVGRK